MPHGREIVELERSQRVSKLVAPFGREGGVEDESVGVSD